MARKTKAEAAQTRMQIIDAARKVFAERGVSRTTFDQIATVAGVSRGAIYWHFANKSELFFAMRDQVCLPLTDRIDASLLDSKIKDPLQGIMETLFEILSVLEEDEITRQTFEIMTLKCEYVDEFSAALDKVMKPGNEFMRKLVPAYGLAKQKNLLREELDPALLALGSYTFMHGLMRLWISDKENIVVRKKAKSLIEAHVNSCRK